jgi:adenosylcobinamide-phosphate guanylyltransferase
MEVSEEKPLLKVGGRPVIEHVLTSLLNATKVSSVVVAVSCSTPKTAGFVKKFPVTVVETPGDGYIPDMQYAVKTLGLQTVLAVVSDLPLITSGPKGSLLCQRRRPLRGKKWPS